MIKTEKQEDGADLDMGNLLWFIKQKVSHESCLFSKKVKFVKTLSLNFKRAIILLEWKIPACQNNNRVVNGVQVVKKT